MCLMGIVQKLFLACQNLLLMKYIIPENNFDIAFIWSLAHRLLQGDFALNMSKGWAFTSFFKGFGQKPQYLGVAEISAKSQKFLFSHIQNEIPNIFCDHHFSISHLHHRYLLQGLSTAAYTKRKTGRYQKQQIFAIIAKFPNF